LNKQNSNIHEFDFLLFKAGDEKLLKKSLIPGIIKSSDFERFTDLVLYAKLRNSAGKTGNQGISPYQTFERYGSTEVYDWQNSQNTLSAGPGFIWDGTMVGIGNPDLRWETTTQYVTAIESGFLNNRLRINVETYFKHTTDLLRDKFLSPSAGFNRIMVNAGVINNWGIEFQIGSGIIEKNDFSFDTELLFSLNRNKVVDIGRPEDAGLIEDENGNQYVYATNDGSVVYTWRQ